MADMLKILGLIIRWGDLEAYLNVVYSDRLEYVGGRVGQVDGSLGLGEGKGIFGEVGGTDGKVEFYKEFLGFL
jgi:hypothetical protein